MIHTLLFDKRADIDWQDHHGQTPLVYAIGGNLLSTASLLLDFDPCLNITYAKHRPAIWYSIAFCGEDLVQVLLERGSDIRTPDYKRFSPFRLAIAKKTPRITQLQSHPRSSKRPFSTKSASLQGSTGSIGSSGHSNVVASIR
jgi:ankyrin repeat protein